jgi:hypothetical protein
MARPCVYALFDDNAADQKLQCNLLRLWYRSWYARGWQPRLLTSANSPPYPYNLCDVAVMNFSFRPSQHQTKAKIISIPFGDPAWEHCPLVLFKRAEDVENCGRPL